jgi:3'-5' exoribonuclease 1
MNYIIFDLEATCWEGEPMGRIQETIEIGAVKLDEYCQIQGKFNKFIKPILHPNLSFFCTKLTSIKQEDIDKSSKFPSVINDFMNWIDVYEEEYLLCSWGDFDRKILVQDCKLHQLDENWLDNHINLKKQYQEITRQPSVKGLKAAVKKEGFEFTGIHHRGIADAENLAKIFIKHFDSWAH